MKSHELADSLTIFISIRSLKDRTPTICTARDSGSASEAVSSS